MSAGLPIFFFFSVLANYKYLNSFQMALASPFSAKRCYVVKTFFFEGAENSHTKWTVKVLWMPL